MDFGNFKHRPKELKSIWLGKSSYWISGSLSLLFRPYKQYILTGEIHCLSNWAILLLSKLLGKKTYTWSHGWYGKETALQSFVKKIYFSLADGVFLYGTYAKRLMVEKGIEEDELHVIYNSLDYDRMQAVRKQLQQTNIYRDKFGNDKPVLFFIGRLEPVKKLDLLIEVLHSFLQKGKKINLAIVGDGSERSHLQKLIKEKNLSEQVWLYGQTYDEKTIGELIYNADICVSPGNVGLTAIHALSFGTPVITHNNFRKQMPEFEAIENGTSGCFFEDGNASSLEEAIEGWLTLHPKKDKELINACYRRIDNFYNPAYQVRILQKGLFVN